MNHIIQISLKYGPTIDRVEADAIDALLADCRSTDLVVLS